MGKLTLLVLALFLFGCDEDSSTDKLPDSRLEQARKENLHYHKILTHQVDIRIVNYMIENNYKITGERLDSFYNAGNIK